MAAVACCSILLLGAAIGLLVVFHYDTPDK